MLCSSTVVSCVSSRIAVYGIGGSAQTMQLCMVSQLSFMPAESLCVVCLSGHGCRADMCSGHQSLLPNKAKSTRLIFFIVNREDLSR